MNKKEIAEIKKRLDPEKNNVPRIRGCYVNEKREIVSTFDQPMSVMPREEAEKYMALFKRALSGVQGQNLVDVPFSTEQVEDSEEHRRLMALRNTALQDEESVQAFFGAVIETLEMEGNYLILAMHDAYDVPFRAKDGMKLEDLSEEVYDYVCCAVCPVKLSKPELRYCAEDKEFHERVPDWVVSAPEVGFLFPTFEDRTTNIYNVLYYTRDLEKTHEEFVARLFRTEPPVPAAAQKERFQAALEDALGEECSYEVVQAVHDQLREIVEEGRADKSAEPPTVTKREVKTMLESSGVSAERVAAFEQKYDEEFGETADLSAVNIVETKQLEVRTPDVVIRVKPERSDLVATRVIDGLKYILIRADDGVELNGVSVGIRD